MESNSETESGNEILRALEETGALRKGHFKLSSGLHSDTYVQCSQLLRRPEEAMKAGRAIAEKLSGKVELVFSPALGAVLIGFATAYALGTEMVFAERSGGAMELRRGFRIEPGCRVLLVEDVITTGGSALELARMVEQAGAEVAGLACIVDRRSAEDIRYPVTSLIRIKAGTYPPEECPLCAEGVPVDSPGSRHVS